MGLPARYECAGDPPRRQCSPTTKALHPHTSPASPRSQRHSTNHDPQRHPRKTRRARPWMQLESTNRANRGQTKTHRHNSALVAAPQGPHGGPQEAASHAQRQKEHTVSTQQTEGRHVPESLMQSIRTSLPCAWEASVHHSGHIAGDRTPPGPAMGPLSPSWDHDPYEPFQVPSWISHHSILH